MRYHNVPKFLDRQILANSADPDQTAPRGAVWSGSTLFAIPSAYSLCIFSKEKPSCSTFRVNTINFRVSKILGGLWYLLNWKCSSKEWARSNSNDLKFSDIQVWSNSVDQDQTASQGPSWSSSLIRVYPVCYFICIFWTLYSIVKPCCSNLRRPAHSFLSWRLGHETISTPILPLPLIQEKQLSERMCTKYW